MCKGVYTCKHWSQRYISEDEVSEESDEDCTRSVTDQGGSCGNCCREQNL